MNWIPETIDGVIIIWDKQGHSLVEVFVVLTFITVLITALFSYVVDGQRFLFENRQEIETLREMRLILTNIDNEIKNIDVLDIGNADYTRNYVELDENNGVIIDSKNYEDRVMGNNLLNMYEDIEIEFTTNSFSGDSKVIDVKIAVYSEEGATEADYDLATGIYLNNNPELVGANTGDKITFEYPD